MYPGRRTRAGRRWALPLRAAVSSGQWPPPVTSHLKIKWGGAARKSAEATDPRGPPDGLTPSPSARPCSAPAPWLSLPRRRPPCSGRVEARQGRTCSPAAPSDSPPPWAPTGRAFLRVSGSCCHSRRDNGSFLPCAGAGTKARGRSGRCEEGAMEAGEEGGAGGRAACRKPGTLAVRGLQRPFLSAQAPYFRPGRTSLPQLHLHTLTSLIPGNRKAVGDPILDTWESLSLTTCPGPVRPAPCPGGRLRCTPTPASQR